MRPAAAALILLALVTTLAGAQPSDDTEALHTEIEALRARLDAIEAAPEPASRLELSGDLRYRHEVIDDDLAATERNRHRIRARFRMAADLGDDLTVGITLATGASNPVSANQSLDGGFTRKDIGFDRAFFAWDVRDEFTMRGGKMGNPLMRPGDHNLIFDGDLNPEGLALGYEGSRLVAHIGGFWVEERGDTDDAILYALQGAYRQPIANGPDLIVGMSYYDYQATQGFEPFYLGDPQGNSVDASGNLINDYDLVELFAEAEIEAGGRPLLVFLDLVENRAADAFETGFAVGFRWGDTSGRGDWELGWAYQDLEADAVIATFTDSDFIGGGTDGKGHVLRGAFQLRDNVRLNGTWFLNERGAATGNEEDYTRVQLDVSFLF